MHTTLLSFFVGLVDTRLHGMSTERCENALRYYVIYKGIAHLSVYVGTRVIHPVSFIPIRTLLYVKRGDLRDTVYTLLRKGESYAPRFYIRI